MEFKLSEEIAISIIIPIYNVEKYLRECLDSILNQTFQDFYQEMIPDFDYVARSIQKTAELEVEKLRDFHQKMWIFVHGIATLLANHTIQLTPLQIEALLKAQFQALLLYEKNKQKEEE